MSFFATYFLPAVLVLITFSIGLTLKLQDFKNIITYPKALLIGLISQMLVLPAVAFGLASIAEMPPMLKIGLVLVAICPGGATSNYITFLCRGNVALSISLTSINSFLTSITLPFILRLAWASFVEDGDNLEVIIPFWKTASNIVLMSLLPCIVGMWVRAQYQDFALVLSKRMDRILLLLLGIAFGAVMLEKDPSPQIQEFPVMTVLLFAFALNIAGLSLGYLLAWFARLDKATRVTTGIEVGLQNSMLAITVAGTLIGSMEMARVGVVYGSFTFFTALAFGVIFSPHLSIIQFFKTGKLYKKEVGED